jgi:iron complex transport system substrate-binding protein
VRIGALKPTGYLLASLFMMVQAAAAGRTVIDLSGRKVIVPDRIERVACLEILCYSRMFMLGADDRIAVMYDTPAPWMRATNRRVRTIPKLNGDFQIEDLLIRRIDVAFFLYDTKQVIAKLNSVGIPGLISQPYADGQYVRRPRSAAEYAVLAKRMVTLFGDVLGGEAKKRAETWCAYFDERVRFVTDRVRDIPQEKRRKVFYVRGPQSFHTQGIGSYTYWLGIMAGANMVVRKSSILGGTGAVAIEDVLAWNPDVVIVGRQYPLSRVLDDARWKPVAAVQRKEVYRAPNGVFYWDGGPESILMMLFMAKKLYPERFADYDFAAEVRTYYQRFYRYRLSDRELARFVSGLPPEPARR